MVGVAHREGLGEFELERDVEPVVVRHRGGGLGGDPAVVPAARDGRLPACPLVVERVHVLGVHSLRARRVPDPVRHHHGVPVGLLVHGPPGAQRQRVGITEAAHTPEGAEVVVEGAILLHQEHDVFDRLQAARRDRRGEGRLQRRRQERSRRGGADGTRTHSHEPAARHLERH